MARNYRLILFFSLFGVFYLTAQNVLKYKLSVGDSLFIEQKAVQDIVQDMNGSKHEMKNQMEGDFVFEVKSKTDSSYVFQFQFTRFKLVTTSNLYGEIVNVDTNNEVNENDIQAKIFSGLITTALEMEMLNTGEIKSVSNTEALVENMVNKANVDNEFTKQLIIESMKKEFGKESLARSFEQMTLIYCKKPVAIGDTWTNNYSGELSAKNLWTLKAIDSVMTLNAKSEIEMFTKEPTLTMTLKGIQDTEVVANKSTCMINKMTVNSTSSGVTVMEEMKNIEIPTTITSTTTYNIKHYVQ